MKDKTGLEMYKYFYEYYTTYETTNNVPTEDDYIYFNTTQPGCVSTTPPGCVSTKNFIYEDINGTAERVLKSNWE